PDRQAEGPGEARRRHKGAVRRPGPQARGNVEPDLVEARISKGPDLLCIRGHRVQVRVERRAELPLQEADVAARPLDRVEGIATGNPRAGRADCTGLFEDVFVSGDALLVREDDVMVHLLVGDGAVKAVEG